jgi:hypothetical protein
MRSNTDQGMALIYNGGMTNSTQQGAGIMDWINKAKKAHDWVKKNKIISKATSVASTLGADKFLDAKTGGRYSKGAKFAKSKGYGKRTVVRTRTVVRKR